MESKILVSVSCTTYNQKNFIQQCLDGFLLQVCNFNFEILIHDDASNDGTQEIISEYEEKYPNIIKPYFQKENQWSKGVRGMNAKYNFSRAQGKYIAMCEGDDYWSDPYKLQKQVDFLESNPNYVMTYHDAHAIDAEGKLLIKNIVPSHRKRDFSRIELQQGVLVMPLTMCFVNVFKGMREYPPEAFEVTNGDTFLISLLGNHGNGKFIEDIEPAMYREYSGGIWSSLSESKRSSQQIITYEKMFQYYERIGDHELAVYFKKRIVNANLSLIKHAIQNGNLNQGYKLSKNVINLSTQSSYRNIFLILKSILRGIIYEKK